PRTGGDRIITARGPGERQRLRVLTSPGLASVLGCILIAGAGGGVMDVTLPALAVHLGYRAASGLLIGLWAAAGIAGVWIYTTLHWSAPTRVRYRAAALTSAALPLPLLGASALGGAIALSVIAGLPTAALYACQYSLVGELAPGDSMTESFTWMT